MRYGTILKPFFIFLTPFTHKRPIAYPQQKLASLVFFVLFIGASGTSFAHEESENQSYSELLTAAKASQSKPENCLNIRRFKNAQMLDNHHLIFTSTGRAWLNELPAECTAMKRAKVLVFDRYVRRICNRDSVKGADPKTGSFTGSCIIGNFVEIEKSLAKRLLRAAKNG
jgi:hypothetical protein